MGNSRLTAIIPCYGRYERTKRIANQIAKQEGCNKNDFEAFFIGDGCSVFQRLMDEDFFKELNVQSNVQIHSWNMIKNYGGFGYECRNFGISKANSKYIIFIDNDDEIMPNHFVNYLLGIEGTEYDMVYYNSIVEPYGGHRAVRLEFGSIGHSEIIVSTEMIRKVPPQVNEYGHDWILIKSIVEANAKVKYSYFNPPTYIVKGVPNKREEGIN
jgi:glycosyltransferase involved in cell wall biosynthesis